DATVDELERWLASMRADGLAPSTVARRISAVRAYFRHLVLIGARAENPAASLKFPRRGPTLPPLLAPSQTAPPLRAEARQTPRVEEARGAGRMGGLLRVGGGVLPEARCAERASSTLAGRVARVAGTGGKDRPVPLGPPGAEPVPRYPALGGPHFDRRYRP